MGAQRKAANAIWGTACQNAAYLAAICDLLGSVFGRAEFSRIFIFGPPDFFADFLAGFFRLIFVGKSAQKNPPGKSPQKSSKIYTTKILRHISAEGPAQDLELDIELPPVGVLGNLWFAPWTPGWFQ